MDLLHRKIKDLNDDVYFLTASNENPYYFIQCHGLVKMTNIFEDIIVYYIQLLDVTESSDMLLKMLSNNQTFHVYQNTKKQRRTFDKKFLSNQLDVSNVKQNFINMFKKYYFEVPSMFTFETYEEMKMNVISLNTEIISMLNERIEFITRRQFI